MRWPLALLVACGGAPRAAPPPAAPPPPGHVRAATRDQCERLLVHLIDLEYARLGPPPPAASTKQAVLDSKRDEFHAVCVDRTPAPRVECAIAAPDLDGVAKCDDAP